MSTPNVITPVGRIVWGHPMKPQIKKNFTTKQPVLKDGKQVEEWACGVAFPTPVFEQFILPILQYEASLAYPNGVPRDFSWKYVRDTEPDKAGKPHSLREGYAGHVVLTVKTEAFCPPAYKKVNGAFHAITASEIKCGDYVVFNLTVSAHKNNDGGIYINPNGFELVGLGQEIVNSAQDPNEMFANAQYQLPAGATPLGAAPMPQMGQPPAPQGYTPPPQQYVPAPVAPNLPPPAHDFVQNAGYQAAPPAPQGYTPPPQQYVPAPVAPNQQVQTGVYQPPAGNVGVGHAPYAPAPQTGTHQMYAPPATGYPSK